MKIKNYEEFKKYLEEIIQQKDFYKEKYELKNKFPDVLKYPLYLLPKLDKIHKFPICFEIVKTDLFYLLIKEDDFNDNYNIKIEDNNNQYEILFENNIIILRNKSNENNNLFCYSIKRDDYDNQFYEIKYIFQYENNSILDEEINNIKKSNNINNYILSYLGLSLNKRKQNIIKKENGNNIGLFINLLLESKIEKLGIASFKKPPLIGLVNVGATCYMNATLQCFSNIDSLTHFFMTNKKKFYDKKKYDLVIEYIKLIDNLWDENIDSKNKYYEPNDFKKKIGEKNPLFSGIAANDSKDLIMFILEQLHKELNNPRKIEKIDNNNNDQSFPQTNEKVEYNNFNVDYYSQNNSIIQKLFYGEIESITYCYNCGIKLFSFSIFNFLIFPLEKVRQFLISNNNYGLGYVTLLDCFNNYITPEIMSGPNQMYCNFCKQQSNFSTSNIIYKHPEIFIIILNRGKGIEFQVPFQYPPSFILNDYMNLNNNDNYKINQIIEYELISVITHIGDSSMSGHFIACCKSPADGHWYCYNDAIVTECKNPLNIFGNNNTSSIPYVLFYQIKKRNNMILYFPFENEKELFLDVKGDMKFEEVVNLLFEKYNDILKKQYNFIRTNGNKIDFSKTIKENGISNEEKILIK